MPENTPHTPTHFGAAEPYAPRRMAFVAQWQLAGFDIKAYAIQRNPGLETPLLPADVIDAARGHAEAALTAARQAPGSYGLGFCIMHAGAEANWLLIHWWKKGGILCQKLLRAPLASPCAYAAPEEGVMACVWELAVINHERDAWLRHMLTHRPDPGGYLNDRMPEGLF